MSGTPKMPMAIALRDARDWRSWGRGRQPVINVTWDDAKRYAAWLSKVTGKTYRLLSENQNGNMPRAPRRRRSYFWGDEIGKNKANCDGCGSEWDKRSQTVRSAHSHPNAFGLYDMQGNVADGSRISPTPTTKAHRRTARRGRQRRTVSCVNGISYAAVPTATHLKSFARRTAAPGTTPKVETTTSASVSRGRLTVRSLSLYLLDPRRSPGRYWPNLSKWGVTRDLRLARSGP